MCVREICGSASVDCGSGQVAPCHSMPRNKSERKKGAVGVKKGALKVKELSSISVVAEPIKSKLFKQPAAKAEDDDSVRDHEEYREGDSAGDHEQGQEGEGAGSQHGPTVRHEHNLKNENMLK